MLYSHINKLLQSMFKYQSRDMGGGGGEEVADLKIL